jgi:uncharacterized membrane protein YgcG
MMINPRWWIAIPIVLAAMSISAPARGSSIHDRAHMFSEEAVKKAQAELNRIERATRVPVVIETIEKVPGLDAGASRAERDDAINSLAVRRDNAIKDEGIYFLISKNDRLNSNILVRERFAALLPKAKRDRIGEAFIDGFKKKDFDGGLLSGVHAIERALEGASIGHKAAEAPGVLPAAARPRGGQSTMGPMGTFLLIIVGIFGVLLVLRLLGGLFGRSAGAGYPGQMGGMGMRPGMGPGGPGYYGGPGYGGRGGGFFSGMLGGLGGALAGNWLYDQFSGRHGGMTASDAMHSTDYGAGGADQGGDAIVGADDSPAGGNSWDDGGGADTGGGGGDWGGGGGGGDWGGGGGDWGGGGGGDW